VHSRIRENFAFNLTIDPVLVNFPMSALTMELVNDLHQIVPVLEFVHLVTLHVQTTVVYQVLVRCQSVRPSQPVLFMELP